MGSAARQLHILCFPLMAPGHMIPMVDMAKLFARRGVRASVVTTPSNSPAVEASLRRAGECGHRVEILEIEFPAAEAGLPDGYDNLASITSPDMQLAFLASTALLRRPFEQLLREHRPDAIVTDMFFPWTLDVADEVGVPRLVFHGTGFFPLVVGDVLYLDEPQKSLPDGEEHFFVPGIPHRIVLTKSQMPDFRRLPSDFVGMFVRMKESEKTSYGVVVNSVYEMEPDYADYYRTVLGRKAWHVGPLSLCNEEAVDKAAKGGRDAVDQARCLSWLATKEPSSVLYVCFGSLCLFTAAQLREIAAGLEASAHPFIWVVRNAGQGEPSETLPEGFEERTAGSRRGMVIRGWAPQLLILNHEAVGGFVTHCGWNSTLEGVTAGVPMATWPMFADQFYNERLLVDVLQIGVPVGAKYYTLQAEDRPLVRAEEIASAVDRLMGSGQEAGGMRRRARELMASARRAVERGGSSYEDMSRLIQELGEKRAAPPCRGRD